MKLAIMAATALVLSPMLAPVEGAPVRKIAKPSGQCPGFQKQYETDIDAVSRYMAFSKVLDAADEKLHSSVEQKQSNSLSRAKLSMDMLKANNCPIPAVSPEPELYGPGARGCSRSMIMARYGNDRVLGCDPEKWLAFHPPK